MKCRVRLLKGGHGPMLGGPEFRASPPPTTRGRGKEGTYVRGFFGNRCGELAGFSAPRDAGAGAGVGTTLPNL